ncbi:MAG: universal stress protein [Pseudomonadota bacterium]
MTEKEPGTFREIVVDACPKLDVHRTLEHARETAVEFGASLSVVSFAWPRISIVGDVLAAGALSTHEHTRAMEEALRGTRSAFDEVLSGTGVEAEWCSAITEPSVALREHLLIADLLITSAHDEGECVSPNAAELILTSGTPVLRLGKSVTTSRFPRIIVAWKDSSQARRAAHDALPFLQRADSVAVVGVGDEVSSDRLEAVAKHLRRHDVAAKHVHVPFRGNTAIDLLDQAEREEATLIVAGVYNRTPFAERVLGGVTAELIKKSDTSWFMGH